MKQGLSKGDRLNWTPLKELKQVSLNEELTKGHSVSEKELRDRRGRNTDESRHVLVP